jgi:hypothetical protein
MKYPATLYALCGLCAAFTALGCSSSSDTSSSNKPDTSITPGSHGENQSCPNGVVDCAAGLLCDTDDPNGQCFKTCTPGMDSQCGDPTLVACNFEGHCYPRCAQTSDCARASEGYTCQDDQPPRAPVKFCDGP